MDIMTNKSPTYNWENLDTSMNHLKGFIQEAARNAKEVYEVEKTIFNYLLKMGQQALSYFFELQGNGDVGETWTSGNGESFKRLGEHSRHYLSIFGNFTLVRCVYGTREGQKIECIPLDARLGLPASDYGHLIQEWSQHIAVEMPFEKTALLLETIFPIQTPVDSLERLNRAQAEDVSGFRSLQTIDGETEEKILVYSVDGKGVPIRHSRDHRRIEDHRHKKGPKPDRKRMAAVGAVYSVAPYRRTPEEVLEALFLEPGKCYPPPETKRPEPKNKQVVANLTRSVNDEIVKAMEMTFHWIAAQVGQRDPTGEKPHVALMDGQLSLWKEKKRQLKKDKATEILDLLHVTSRLWDVAAIFNPNDSQGQIQFMKKSVLKVLQGKAPSVIRHFRKLATKKKLAKSRWKNLEIACGYLEKNLRRMRYHQYLKKGYPIASGVIEGACRHYVKDRMERAGMRWSIEGAQAMLDVRSIHLNGQWDEFTAYRRKKEKEKLYPYRGAVNEIYWPLAA